ncbi:hypothetical protein LTR39_004091, partial [Cryomyces antarcticus]
RALQPSTSANKRFLPAVSQARHHSALCSLPKCPTPSKKALKRLRKGRETVARCSPPKVPSQRRSSANNIPFSGYF